jgi:glycosyltransferase involved in cell wall biosynthesis
MHIVFVTHGSFDTHATLKRATGMATPLFKEGHQVTILMQDSAANREKILLECPEVDVCWFPSGLSSLKERNYKQRCLNELRPKLVWICAVGFRNWMSRPIRNSILLADHSELISHIGFNRLRKIFYWFIEWGYLLCFDAHVCASRYLEEFYKRRLRFFGKRDKVHYSPYAYHPDMICTDAPDAKKLLHRWQGRKTIVYMGGIWENYGFWDMLHAYKELAQQRNDFVAVFIGGGPEKEKGIEWVNANGLNDVINIEGYVAEEDLPAYFVGAHAFLSPLRDTIQDWARCPSKLFMYLPYKKPVITCPIGEAKELFGDFGNYFEPGNVSSLVTALEKVLDAKSFLISVASEKHSYAARVETFVIWYRENINGRV